MATPPFTSPLTSAQIAGIKNNGTVQVSYQGTCLTLSVENFLKFATPSRRLVTSIVNFTATAGSQARDTVNFTVPAGEFQVGDIVSFRFKGKVVSASNSNCTVTGEVNNAGTPTTAVGLTSGTLVAASGGLAVEFSGMIKWTSATAWATMTDAGTAATVGSGKVLADAHLVDLCLTVAGATDVTITGMFTADLVRVG